MDNLLFDVTLEGDKALRHALAIAMENAPGGKARGFVVLSGRCLPSEPVGQPTLLLFWNTEELNGRRKEVLGFPVSKFAFAHGLDDVVRFVGRWLQEQEAIPAPAWFDGSTGGAWRVWCEQWGHVFECHYVICAVRPVLAMYGK